MNISTRSLLFGKANLKVDAPVSNFPSKFQQIDPNAIFNQDDPKKIIKQNWAAQTDSARKALASPALQQMAETLPDGLTLVYHKSSDNSPPVITVTQEGKKLAPIPYQDFWLLPTGYTLWKRALSIVADRLQGKQPPKAELKVESSDQVSERLKARLEKAKAAIRSPQVQELLKGLPDGMELVLRTTPERQLEIATLKDGEPFMPPITQQTLGVNFDFQFDYLIWLNAVTIVKDQIQLASGLKL